MTLIQVVVVIVVGCAHMQTTKTMLCTCAIPAPSQNDIVWTKVSSFWDKHGRKIDYHMSMVSAKKPFISLHFSNESATIPIPHGVIVTNNVEEWARFNAVFPLVDSETMGVAVEEGFQILYLGQTLASAPPNIQSKEEIKQHEVQRFN